MRSPHLLLAVFLLTGLAVAQQLPTPEELVPRIQAYAQQYRLKVPSFEVDESAVSQAFENGKLKREVKLEMTLRQIRDDKDPEELNDSYTVRLVDGKPPRKYLNLPPFNRKAKLPYFVRSVFSNVIGFAGKGLGECTSYRVSLGPTASTVTLDVANKPGPVPDECKGDPQGYQKTLVVERDSGRVLHVIRSMSPESAARMRDVVFADVEFAPQKLGDEIFWLPIRFTSHNGPNDRRMTATYSNFHRYTSTVKIIASDPLPEVEP